MCFARHELDVGSTRSHALHAGRHAGSRVPGPLQTAAAAPHGGPAIRSSGATVPRRREGPAATLTGPSRTITVEPIVVPSPDPARAPDRREAPAEPRPAERPAEEPVPSP
jgi:hypothetical protein